MPDRVGFIGLGIMGRPMASNLLRAGFPVTVWNRSRPGIEALVAEGAAEAANAGEVAARSDIVITMVGDSPDVEQVALGADGIIGGAHAGLVHVDMSTISPEVTRHISDRLADAEVEMLDAPVSGGETGAINATLSIMAGGKEEVSSAAGQCSRPRQEAGLLRPIRERPDREAVQSGRRAVTNLAVSEALTLCIRSASTHNGCSTRWRGRRLIVAARTWGQRSSKGTSARASRPSTSERPGPRLVRSIEQAPPTRHGHRP
jgi:hypothetical protein